MAHIMCNDCGADAEPLDWRCFACGGSLDLIDLPAFDPERIDASDFSLWRYRAMLPVERRFSLGEGMTPLVPIELDGLPAYAKLEYLNPTGSFKDRGTATLLNHLAAFGVKAAIDNSSGNAGASLAAYAGVAGMAATVYVPAATAVESKKRLVQAFGGGIIESHDYLADVYAAAENTTYASHAWSPYFVLGQQTAAWETWEQLGRRAPDAVAAPGRAWRALPGLVSRLQSDARGRADCAYAAHDRRAIGRRRPHRARMGSQIRSSSPDRARVPAWLTASSSDNPSARQANTERAVRHGGLRPAPEQ